MPQERCYGDPGRAWKTSLMLQIKNIKLHIVTDIKVNFNSMLGFRISLFGWGAGYFNKLKKLLPLICAISFIEIYSYYHVLGTQAPLGLFIFCHA